MREPYTKSALTYGEQLELLRGRGLDVGDADAAEFYLANLNYYTSLTSKFAPRSPGSSTSTIGSWRRGFIT